MDMNIKGKQHFKASPIPTRHGGVELQIGLFAVTRILGSLPSPPSSSIVVSDQSVVGGAVIDHNDGRDRRLQGTSKRLFPGCVKLGEKVVFCLHTAGRKAQLFYLIFTQPGVHQGVHFLEHSFKSILDQNFWSFILHTWGTYLIKVMASLT